VNLRVAHLLPLTRGGLIGAGIGWLISLPVPNDTIPSIEGVVPLYAFGLLMGFLAGAGVTIVILVVEDSARSNTPLEVAPTSINGMGSMFYGKSDVRQDGSYLTTEWFTILYLPVVPLRSFRVLPLSRPSTLRRIINASLHGLGVSPHIEQYVIVSKHPPNARQVVNVYICLVGGITLVAFLLWFLTTGYWSLRSLVTGH
jgi:hypothetical protein